MIKQQKMKSLKYYLMIMSATLGFWSCSDDNDPAVDNGSNVAISLSSDTIQVAKEGGSVAVTVTSDGDWRLAGTCEWAHPSATEGKSGEEVTFTVDENTTGEKLSATFKFFTGSTVVPLLIESNPDYTLSLLSEDLIEIAEEGGKATVNVQTNIADLSIVSSEGWVVLARQNDFKGERIIQLTVNENDTYLPRSSSVTVSSPLTEEVLNITINQSPTEKFEVTQENMENNTIVYDDYSARSVEFKVLTNLEFTAEVAEGNDWIEGPQISEPVVGDDGLSAYTVTYDLSAAQQLRAGTINFVANEFEYAISIVQKSSSDKLIDIPDAALASALEDNGWIVKFGNQYSILEDGLNATALEYDDYYNRITDLTGIENFPNLEKVSISVSGSLKKIDISGLHKVKELGLHYGTNLSLFNLGDNPITTFSLSSVISYGYTFAESLTFISEKMEELDLYLYSSPFFSYTKVIDVSECPSLKKLNAVGCSNALEKIILKQGQEIPELLKDDSVTIEYK